MTEPQEVGRRSAGDAGPSDAFLPAYSLPRFPALPRYAEIDLLISQLSMPHAAVALFPPIPVHRLAQPGATVRFRVVDGLWVPGAGSLDWTRVDAAYLARVRESWDRSADPRATRMGTLLDRLDAALAEDPMALRRLVLYQLAVRLSDGSTSSAMDTAAVAERLGVHPDEAGTVAAAVTALPLDASYRGAAEGIMDALDAGMFTVAREFAHVLGAAARTDHRLAAVLDRVHAHFRRIERLSDESRRLLRTGKAQDAARYALAGLALSGGDPDPSGGPGRDLRGDLLAAAAARADTRTAGPALAVTVAADDSAALGWPRTRPGDTRTAQFVVLRFLDEDPGAAVIVGRPGTARTFSDTGGSGRPEAGLPYRYAVAPLDASGAVCGIPLVGPVLLSTPEARGLRADLVPHGVRLSWLPHTHAAAVRVSRRTARGRFTPLTLDPTTGQGPVARLLTDTPLPPGGYRYRLQSGYRMPDGSLMWSRGVTMDAESVTWPSPVDALSWEKPRPADAADGFAPEGDLVRITWDAPRHGRSLLVRWEGSAPQPGADVSGRLARLDGVGILRQSAPQAATASPSAVVSAMPRTSTRYTLVSVLGDRAVAGASVLLQSVAEPHGCTVKRSADLATVSVRFGWPEPAVLVRVRLEQDGVARERTVARSDYLAHGLSLPVHRGPGKVTVVPRGRPDAVQIRPDVAIVTGFTAAPPPPVPEPALQLRDALPSARAQGSAETRGSNQTPASASDQVPAGSAVPRTPGPQPDPEPDPGPASAPPVPTRLPWWRRWFQRLRRRR